jgi:hypothetical protein
MIILYLKYSASQRIKHYAFKPTPSYTGTQSTANPCCIYDYQTSEKSPVIELVMMMMMATCKAHIPLKNGHSAQ